MHGFRVHFLCVKNITLSADDDLIDRARLRASRESKSLNELFRAWLRSYADQPLAGELLDDLHKSLEHVRAGGKFSREEMNER